MRAPARCALAVVALILVVAATGCASRSASIEHRMLLPQASPPGEEVEEDPRFERDGEDLYTEVLVTYPQLALGSNVEVPMVTGTVSLQVPAGTQSGQVFNLRGRGLPRINSSSAGDLHVRLQLWTPDNLSEDELALINRLGELQKVPPARPKGLWSKLKESLGA